MKSNTSVGFLIGIATILIALVTMAGFPSHTADGDQFVPANLTVNVDLDVDGDANVDGTLTYTEVDYDFVPIEWCEDGAVAPDVAATVTNGNGSITARDFGGAAGATVHDVVCPWEVPEDIVVASGIKFEPRGVITDATGPSAEGISFKMSGYSAGDNDSIGGAFGSEIETNVTGYTSVQYDRLEVPKSAAVTVTNLAAGEVAMLHFERDTADGNDDYAQPVGVTGFYIWYERATGSLTF
jgi:hypothetical protein